MAPILKPTVEKYDFILIGGGSGGVACSVSICFFHDLVLLIMPFVLAEGRQLW